jgi:hypothetical protein
MPRNYLVDTCDSSIARKDDEDLSFTPTRFSEKHIDIYGMVKGEAIKFQNLQDVKTQLLS